MRICSILCCLLLAVGTFSAIAEENSTQSEKAKPFVKIKRPALWVPDLDRAILFYRDVLGFSLKTQGDLSPIEDSVLFDLFNADSSLKFRRAIFSSSTEENGLFVMETTGAPEYSTGQKRSAALIINTDDLAAVESRAEQYGFMLGNANQDTAANGKVIRERTIIGPGGNAALVYQFD